MAASYPASPRTPRRSILVRTEASDNNEAASRSIYELERAPSTASTPRTLPTSRRSYTETAISPAYSCNQRENFVRCARQNYTHRRVVSAAERYSVHSVTVAVHRRTSPVRSPVSNTEPRVGRTLPVGASGISIESIPSLSAVGLTRHMRTMNLSGQTTLTSLESSSPISTASSSLPHSASDTSLSSCSEEEDSEEFEQHLDNDEIEFARRIAWSTVFLTISVARTWLIKQAGRTKTYMGSQPATSGGCSGTSESQSHENSSSQPSQGSAWLTTNGKRRMHGRNQDGDSEDKDDDEEAPFRQAKKVLSETEQRWFACPYHKADPSQYSRNAGNKHYRNCEDCILRDMAALKQHLHRIHTKKDFYCPTCHLEFLDDALRDQHIKERSCKSKEDPCPEKMSIARYRIVCRKKDRCEPAHDHWYQIFNAIFPGYREPADPYRHSQNPGWDRHLVRNFAALAPRAALQVIDESDTQIYVSERTTELPQNIRNEAFSEYVRQLPPVGFHSPSVFEAGSMVPYEAPLNSWTMGVAVHDPVNTQHSLITHDGQQEITTQESLSLDPMDENSSTSYSVRNSFTTTTPFPVHDFVTLSDVYLNESSEHRTALLSQVSDVGENLNDFVSDVYVGEMQNYEYVQSTALRTSMHSPRFSSDETLT